MRSQFPALAREQIYMDNAGGSLTLERIADRVRDYLLSVDVQHGASYPVATEAAERYAAARQRLAHYVSANSAEEIVFGPSTTVLLRLLADAMAGVLHAGDEVIVTRVDHEANIGCWLRLEALGVRTRFWERNPESGDLALEDLDALLSTRTRLVCVTQVSNILGNINPIRAIAERVHAAGAWICVDGVAYAPHRDVDVQALGVDFYAISLYKVYGPHHALLYCRREPFLRLGSTNHFFYGRDRIPGKLEPGNANYELSWGSAGIVDYLEDLGRQLGSEAGGRHALERAWQAIADHEELLAAQLLSFLLHRPDIRVLGNPSPDRDLRVPTISFIHDRLLSSEIVSAMDRHGIGIRHGHFHAYRLIEDLRLLDRDGVVRVSLVHYNSVEEVDRLVAALETIFEGPND